ncbi:hypothetical protein [Diplocloster modestus]|uniref:Uncharacterized protein n=1 Tax=Diplocloster modestus TaxID=2850322 RepID=A0ABS6K977_9FIRM|nr:hypothetical protein [Diplocloster modestus]MBU9727057.1 hypothetical protein [Diplocloster modestus]
MKKLIAVLGITMLMVGGITACGSKDDNKGTENPQQTEAPAAAPEAAKAPESAVPTQGETADTNTTDGQTEGAEAQEEKTFTGIVDEVKQGMLITVATEDDSNAYVFGLEGDVTAKVGDKVKVTYTGGNLEDMEGNLVATKIEVLK